MRSRENENRKMKVRKEEPEFSPSTFCKDQMKKSKEKAKIGFVQFVPMCLSVCLDLDNVSNTFLCPVLVTTLC